MWFPIGTNEQISHSALDRRNPAKRFGVARRELVPDAPDVFPALVPDAIEVGGLQAIGSIAPPALADIPHVPRLKPFVFADHGDLLIPPIAPAHCVPGDH